MRIRELADFAAKVNIAFPTAEEYGGLSGFYDWGIRGSQLKKNLKDLWWKYFVLRKDFVVGLDGSIITHPRVWEASGHVEEFHDPVTRCKRCGRTYRVDHLIKEVKGIDVEGKPLEELAQLLKDIPCPACGGELEPPRYFNLMFETTVGPFGGMKAYLRPETAQVIFADFPRLYLGNRKRLPFAVAQMGKAYRNEISPRNFLFRLREFEQMEIEFFFDPQRDSSPFYDDVKDYEVLTLTIEDQERGNPGEIRRVSEVVGDYPGREWMVYWIVESLRFLELAGVDKGRLRIRQQLPDERAHYSMDTWDVEFHFDDLGWKEIEGIAHRSDYDLSRHYQYSRSDKYKVKREDGSEFVPWVIEPSWGVERVILAILYSSFRRDEKRTWLSLKPWIAPVQVAVFPLVSKDGLPKKAREVRDLLLRRFVVEYDEKGSIGKRYRRHDEIGTPFAVTVDHQTLEDNTVTVRERDSMAQERVRIEDLLDYLSERIEW
ncbi:MAG: glycine--tRNA ligase [Candidatus Diapherotrites archaeon]|nr:glycine--tRNA ligase [Candidatus Diapherotrites archaeon]